MEDVAIENIIVVCLQVYFLKHSFSVVCTVKEYYEKMDTFHLHLYPCTSLDCCHG